MVYEKTQTYELKDKKINDFQTIIEDLMTQSLKIEARSAKVDDTLTIITFLDPNKDKDLQKENKIALYQEDEKVYVQVKGELTDNEAEVFWGEIEKRLEEPPPPAKEELVEWDDDKELRKLGFLSESSIVEIKSQIIKLLPNKKKFVIERLKEIEKDLEDLKNEGIEITEIEKEKFRLLVLKKKKSERKAKLRELVEDKKGLTAGEAVHLIINSIKSQGYSIDYSEVNSFIENFQEQYNRAPRKEEIPSIASGYIKMKASEIVVEVPEEAPAPITPPTPPPTPEVEISPSEVTDALIEIINDYTFLIENEKGYFIKLLPDYDLGNQKKLVENIEYLEKMIGKTYEFDKKERVTLRKQLIMLDKDEISLRIDQVLTQKRAVEDSLGWNTERQLRKLGFLTEPNINVVFKMIEKLPEERQKEVIDRLKEIEEEVKLSNFEKEKYRTDLVKLTKKNRRQRLMDLIKERKEEIISEKIFDEIPQLRFEDNKKLIKELIWLNKDEIDQRIENLKKKINKKLEKKQELFEKSSAGSTCSECGWPVGSFSKKCPRCGRKLIDWM
jgi:hypothetical protein